ncbi:MULTISPECIES: DUF3139 domain-containing protein [unclassified Paenibacillus]|uniref:DUF3139 domain-containing protein n=1 Tax=unclassified Paenibacillus TaxID=185978 RepID=UPI00020D76D0|nr:MULTISPECIES: DUF3139 domain-containing protein [unclassified Paenibacillus]EGL19263.1 hypothetical protein HMPREF9413_5065 [Paenibacillus sp. HGF7]EPD92624.1 hypothetical protein HMPREF1207_00395 [Paenibacillus sp. HGH0039]
MRNLSRGKIFALSIVLIVLLALFVYVQGNKMAYAERVRSYLLQEKSYKEEELASVKGIWGMKLPSFYTVVVFKDEPEVNYVYFSHNDVLQFDQWITPKGVEMGITPEKLKHTEKRREG